MNMTMIPNEMEFEHVDSTTTSTITTQSDITNIYSLIIIPTTTLTTNNMEEYELTALTTTGDVQTLPRDKDIEVFTIANTTSTPITITIPKMDTPTIIY